MDVTDLLRPVLWIARALLWLGWDLIVRTIGWSIGWVFFRTITFGRFPDTGIGDIEQTSFGYSLIIELTGLLLLAAFVLFVSQYINGR